MCDGVIVTIFVYATEQLSTDLTSTQPLFFFSIFIGQWPEVGHHELVSATFHISIGEEVTN